MSLSCLFKGTKYLFRKTGYRFRYHCFPLSCSWM